MQEAETILGRFPGPVALYLGRRRLVGGLFIWLAILIFCIFLLSGKLGSQGGYDTFMAWFSLFVSAGILVRSLTLLMMPSATRLTLDADGFEIGGVFANQRIRWRDVRAFSISKRYLRGAEIKEIEFTAAGANGQLTNGYSLPLKDLLHLLESWRERATAGKHTAHAPSQT